MIKTIEVWQLSHQPMTDCLVDIQLTK